MSSRALLDSSRDSDTRRTVSTVRSVVLYGLVGLLSLAADLSVFTLLGHGFGIHPLVANCVSRPLGGVVCFFANKYWTFDNIGRKPTATQFVRFWCVFGVSLGLSQGLIWFFYVLLEWNQDLAKIVAEAFIVVFNYLCLRLWTFR